MGPASESRRRKLLAPALLALPARLTGGGAGGGELLAHRARLVGGPALEALLENRDGARRVPGAVERGAEVEGRVRTHELRGGAAGVDGLAEERNGVGVPVLAEEGEPAVVERGGTGGARAGRRARRGGGRRGRGRRRRGGGGGGGGGAGRLRRRGLRRLGRRRPLRLGR